jgi:hypothetical protein
MFGHLIVFFLRGTAQMSKIAPVIFGHLIVALGFSAAWLLWNARSVSGPAMLGYGSDHRRKRRICD